MILTKESNQKREQLKGSLLTVLGNLDELQLSDAELFLNWMVEKSKLYSEAILKKHYHALPDNIQRGDIVLCKFGMNVFPEFSDKDSKNHFAIIWAQQGYNFVVIPITQKKPLRPNPYLIPLGSIPFLSAPCNYAKMDSIRSVSLRRILRISGTSEGKIKYPIIKHKINSAFQKLYIDK